MASVKVIRGLLSVVVCFLVFISNGAVKAAGGVPVPEQDWSFSGVFGTFDRGELQRGFQVYQEVCAGCHSLNYICLLYTSPSPRDMRRSRMPSSA